MIKIILAPTAALAATVSAEVTVEAEYGDITVRGSLYTAAHHGKNTGNDCPCEDIMIPVMGTGTILISHIDLDTVGGVGRAMEAAATGMRYEDFWKLVSFVDINGPHKLAELMGSKPAPFKAEADLYAYWAWAQANRGPRRATDVVHDVTAEIRVHLEILLEIFHEEDGPLHRAGAAMREAEQKLNENSFVDLVWNTIVRVSPAFVNHLYISPSGKVADAVVAFNTVTGGITLSFAEKDDPRSACEIMQKLFGPDAGGHKGIAGTPRGMRMRMGDIMPLVSSV